MLDENKNMNKHLIWAISLLTCLLLIVNGTLLRKEGGEE